MKFLCRLFGHDWGGYWLEHFEHHAECARKEQSRHPGRPEYMGWPTREVSGPCYLAAVWRRTGRRLVDERGNLTHEELEDYPRVEPAQNDGEYVRTACRRCGQVSA